jgi:hypothetical protein
MHDQLIYQKWQTLFFAKFHIIQDKWLNGTKQKVKEVFAYEVLTNMSPSPNAIKCWQNVKSL